MALVQGCVRDHCDELLYQNARRILIAEWQNIIYSEFLPIILGPTSMSEHNLNLNQGSVYNAATNPGIFAAFSTAAYRFGHSLIQGSVEKRNMDGNLDKTFALRYNPLKNYQTQDILKWHMIQFLFYSSKELGITQPLCQVIS